MKTYKREVAGLLLAICVGLTGWFLYSGDENYWMVAQFLFTPSVAFAGMAFGLDSYAKQIRNNTTGI